jgi:hypothetical protein
MPGNGKAALRRSDPDSQRRGPERAADRHAAKIGALGFAGLPEPPPVSVGPASFAGKRAW